MGGELRLEGIIPAVITPFTQKYEIDEDGYRETLRFLMAQGVRGLMCAGSTGEGATLTREERKGLISTTVEEAKSRVPVIAGTGAPSTNETVIYTRDAKDAGADAALVVSPFYIIPNNVGLIDHYRELTKRVDLPIIVYNIPAHTGTNIDSQMLVKLSRLRNIVGIKDSSGNMSQFTEEIRVAGAKMAILTGCDDLLYPSFTLGAPGAIVAIGNIAPKEAVAIYEAVRKGDHEEARRLHYQVLPVARAIGVASNFPAVVKEIVQQLGRPAGPARKPSVPLSEDESKSIREALIKSRLLKVS